MVQQQQLPRGTKFWQPGQLLLVSTGIPSLDDLLIGGGLPVGSICLIKQDGNRAQSVYSDLLARYYLSQALATPGQRLLLCTDDSCAPEELFIKTLLHATSISAASISLSSSQSTPLPAAEQERMKIAWRYQQQQQQQHYVGQQRQVTGRSSFISRSNHPLQSSSTRPAVPMTASPEDFCRIFDLQRPVDEKSLKAASQRIHCCSPSSLQELYQEIYGQIMEHSKSQSNDVLRLAIQSLGSPAFGADITEQDLISFLTALKGLIRHSLATAMITIPEYWWSEKLIRFGSDLALELQPFSADLQAKEQYAREYNGWFIVRRQVRLNTLGLPASCAGNAAVSSRTLAFKCRRRKFCIEPFHLPPDLSDPSASSTNPSASINIHGGGSSTGSGCGSHSAVQSGHDHKLAW